jgi:Type IV secretion system pilin
VFVGTEITDGATAREKLLNVIKGIINMVLGFIGLIALVYLIYHGLVMLFNPGDDGKIDEGWKAIKYAAIAIIGIGVAWFIVSIIFQVIGVVIDATQ